MIFAVTILILSVASVALALRWFYLITRLLTIAVRNF